MTIFPAYEQELRRLARTTTGAAAPTQSRRRRRLARPAAALAVGLPIAVAVAVAAVLLVSLGGRHPGHSTFGQEAGGARPVWLKRFVSHFSALHAEGSFLPRRLESTLRALGTPPLDTRYGQRLAVGGGALWVFPGPSATCIVLVTSTKVAGAHCSPTATVQTAGIELRSGPSGNPYRASSQHSSWQTRIVGLVPNGTAPILVSRTSGPVLTVRVQHNTFSATTQGRVSSARLIRNQPPFPRNAAGQTYGSSAGPTGHNGRAVRVGAQPDLILVTGRSTHGKRFVTGFVRRTQLDAHSCGDVKTPKQALRCNRRNRPTRIPILAINGTTVIGTFPIG